MDEYRNLTKGNDNITPTVTVDGTGDDVGLTKREYMATAILQGLMANPERYKYIAHKMRAVFAPGQAEPFQGMSQEEASAKNANKAVMMADALIEALNK